MQRDLLRWTAIRGRTGSDGDSVCTELQADRYAGAWFGRFWFANGYKNGLGVCAATFTLPGDQLGPQ